MIVVMLVIFYFMLIRPENKKKKQLNEMRNSLKVGDEITTIGGIIGDIVSIKDDSIVIETTTDRVRVEFAKFAVSTNNTAEKEAAKQKAEEILDEWMSGDATEDSFAALAEEKSEDPGSSTNGGLYENVAKGQMVEPFEDWCFDETRVAGDYGLVKTTYGYHVMYFVGYDLPAWAASVTSDLQEKASSEWSTALSENADVQQSDFGMKFVG